MPEQIKTLDFTQPDNLLTAFADAERDRLLPRNDFSPDAYNYSLTHPDALADGDENGRGTGVFLDIYNQNAGTRQDIDERINDVKINKYGPNNPYYTP